MSEGDAAQKNTAQDLISCETNSISFKTQVWPIVKKNCLSCHTDADPQGEPGRAAAAVAYFAEIEFRTAHRVCLARHR